MTSHIGKKTLDEIESLIESNCWKASIWIHALLGKQLRFLLYYHNQFKVVGIKRGVDIILKKDGTSEVKKIKLDGVEENNKKQKKMEEATKFFGPLLNLCYARSLIDEEYDDLKKFNKFRNENLIHTEIDEYSYLPNEDIIKEHCKLGLDLTKRLNKKIHGFINHRYLDYDEYIKQNL